MSSPKTEHWKFKAEKSAWIRQWLCAMAHMCLQSLLWKCKQKSKIYLVCKTSESNWYQQNVTKQNAIYKKSETDRQSAIALCAVGKPSRIVQSSTIQSKWSHRSRGLRPKIGQKSAPVQFDVPVEEPRTVRRSAGEANYLQRQESDRNR